jgi:hypothetical protein
MCLASSATSGGPVRWVGNIDLWLPGCVRTGVGLGGGLYSMYCFAGWEGMVVGGLI